MSMHTLTVSIEGIGLWAPGIADWPAALRVFAGAAPDVAAVAKPSAAALPPAERRRAPEPVLIASEAAGQACAMAGRDPATLACVFASTHGDIAITDTMCETLAADPRELSPIRFHNSVHNAPSGYWTVATHCHAAATATKALMRSNLRRSGASAIRPFRAARVRQCSFPACPSSASRRVSAIARYRRGAGG